MFRIGSQQTQRLDSEVEAASMGVLADTGAERDKVVSSDVGGALDQGLAHVVDLVLVDAETIAAWVGARAFIGRVFNNVFKVVACELEEFFKHCFGLVLVQRSHLWKYGRVGWL